MTLTTASSFRQRNGEQIKTSLEVLSLNALSDDTNDNEIGYQLDMMPMVIRYDTNDIGIENNYQLQAAS